MNVLNGPNAGGLKLFGHSSANNMNGIIHMSRMGLSTQNIDRLQIISQQGREHSSPSFDVHCIQAEMNAQGVGAGVPSVGDIISGTGDERSQISIPAVGGWQGTQTAVSGKLAHQRKKNEDGGKSFSYEDNRSASWGDSGGDYGGRLLDVIEDDDCSQVIKIKAAQALYRMSLRHGEEVCDESSYCSKR